MFGRSVLTLALCLAFGIMIGLAVPALAATAATPASSADKFEGTITFMEKDGTIMIKPDTGLSQLAYVNKETKIFIKGQPATAADLKVGTKISVVYGAMRGAAKIDILQP